MKRLKVFIIIAILAVLAICYFYYLSSKNNEKDSGDKTRTDEIAKIINKDLEVSYPSSPIDVVILYSRIMKCYYGQGYTDEELVELTYKVRTLMDEELVRGNPYDEYYFNLLEEIEEYNKQNKVITSYVIEQNNHVEYSTVEDKEYAVLSCTYYLKSDEGHFKTPEEYVLRKDEQGRWKILYWKLASTGDDDE